MSSQGNSKVSGSYHIFVVSDSSGATAERVVQAALTQFKGASVSIELRSQVRTVTRVRQYADPEFVQRETDYATELFSRHPGWRTIDVTDRPIEEIASEILARTDERQA